MSLFLPITAYHQLRQNELCLFQKNKQPKYELLVFIPYSIYVNEPDASSYRKIELEQVGGQLPQFVLNFHIWPIVSPPLLSFATTFQKYSFAGSRVTSNVFVAVFSLIFDVGGLTVPKYTS